MVGTNVREKYSLMFTAGAHWTFMMNLTFTCDGNCRCLQ